MEAWGAPLLAPFRASRAVRKEKTATQASLLLRCESQVVKCDHLNKTYYTVVLSCGTVYYAVQGGSNF